MRLWRVLARRAASSARYCSGTDVETSVGCCAGNVEKRRNYPYGPMSSSVYPVHGGMEDWAYAASWDAARSVRAMRIGAAATAGAPGAVNVLLASVGSPQLHHQANIRGVHTAGRPVTARWQPQRCTRCAAAP